MFFIYTRTGTAPELIPPAGGGGVFDGSTGAGRRSVIADTTVLATNSIALHIDEKPSSTYAATYDNVSLRSLVTGAAATAGAAFLDAMQKRGPLGGALTKLAGALVANSSNALNAASAATGLRLNPFKRVYFDQMNFRNFEFRYRFLPKSPAESNNVFNIVKLFKFHMHPSSAGITNILQVFPDEFEILYYYGTRENTYWHKISRCVLTDLKVDYGGENFSSFPNGVPSEIYLNMNFLETEVLDKARIESGY
jgi:hypothetical protein